VALWADRDRVTVSTRLLELLEGVGDTARVHWEVGDVALHLRRPLTDDEAAFLPRRKDEPIYPIERA